jgi:2-oxoglutarate ferredoxin oxidoreductase subunit delta
VSTVRGTVTIAVEACKGCDLCIAACPPQVLSMSRGTNAMGYRYPKLAVGCTGCRACLDVCPDFVFEVFKFLQPLGADAVTDDTDTRADVA